MNKEKTLNENIKNLISSVHFALGSRQIVTFLKAWKGSKIIGCSFSSKSHNKVLQNKQNNLKRGA